MGRYRNQILLKALIIHEDVVLTVIVLILTVNEVYLSVFDIFLGLDGLGHHIAVAQVLGFDPGKSGTLAGTYELAVYNYVGMAIDNQNSAFGDIAASDHDRNLLYAGIWPQFPEAGPCQDMD
jgi:hypothetical protein